MVRFYREKSRPSLYLLSVWPGQTLGQAALVVAINPPLGQSAARARHGSQQAKLIIETILHGHPFRCTQIRENPKSGHSFLLWMRTRPQKKRNRRGQVEETCNPSGDSSENIMADVCRYSRQRLHSHAVRDAGEHTPLFPSDKNFFHCDAFCGKKPPFGPCQKYKKPIIFGFFRKVAPLIHSTCPS